MITSDLSKQEALNADPKTIQRISFNLNQDLWNIYVKKHICYSFSYMTSKKKKTILDLSQGT